MSRQENECETESEENVEAILVRLLLWDCVGWRDSLQRCLALPCLAMPCHALPCLAMPFHSSGSQSQIPKSFLVVIRPAWNMIGTVYLLDRPLQAPTILPDLKDTVEE